MKYKLEDRVYTIINDRIYCMMVESVTFDLRKDNTLFGTFTLIHSKSEYNNKTVRYENQIYKTIEELKEKEYLKIDELIKSYKK